MHGRLLVELVLGLAAGVAVVVGARLGERLVDPYSEPRLAVQSWLDQLRGGDPA